MMHERIVTLVDMDCFYCQVEARLNPELQGRPVAVVQYNAWKGGGIIAVNYEARDKGVTRHMRGDEAKNHCPDIELVRVPSVRGKADLTKYRDAGREVINVMCEFSECVQRASIDEAYIDLTEAVEKRLESCKEISPTDLANSFIVGYSPQGNNDEGERSEGVVTWLSDVYNNEFTDESLKRLAVGAFIVEEMRAAIFNKTGFKCSAGIAHNKILAKLVCGLHKPNRQTVLPLSGVPELFNNLPVQKVRSLGGKFGNDVIETLGCKVMGDLSKYSEKELQSYFDEKTGTWLYNIARGIDLEPVTPRLVSKSIGCCKQFRGRTALKTKNDVLHWIGELASEIAERLDEDAHMNKRKAQQLTASVQQMINNRKTPMSRSVPLASYDVEAIAEVAFTAVKRTNSAPQSSDAWLPPLCFLGISVGKFVDESGSSSKTINQYFQNNTTAVLATSSKNNIESNCEIIRDQVEMKGFEKNERLNDRVSVNSKSDVTSKGTSFFERYFKNKTKFLNKSNEDEMNVGSNPNCISVNEPSTSFIDQNLKLETNSTTGDDDSNLENRTVATTESSSISNNIVRDDNTEDSDNGDGTWVSPSEIFPDLNNIDEEVMSLLPSPLQRKIVARSLKNKVQKYDADDLKFNGVDSRKSENENNGSSPIEPPVRIMMTAQVHQSNEHSNSINSNVDKSCLLDEENKNIDNVNKSEIDIIEHNSDYDIFSQLENTGQTVNVNKTDYSDKIEVYVEEASGDDTSKLNSSSSKESSCKLCHYCNENISNFHYQEHVDHHIAVELHEKLNSSASVPAVKKIAPTVVLSKTIKSKSPHKRKKQSDKKSVHIEAKKSRSILSFFTPK